jgi:hypothetical protein
MHPDGTLFVVERTRVARQNLCTRSTALTPSRIHVAADDFPFRTPSADLLTVTNARAILATTPPAQIAALFPGRWTPDDQ